MRNRKAADTVDSGEQLLTVEGVAHKLNIGVRTVWRLDKEKKIPAAKRIGHAKRWCPKDLDLWIQWDCPDRKKFNQLKKERISNGQTIRRDG